MLLNLLLNLNLGAGGGAKASSGDKGEATKPDNVKNKVKENKEILESSKI